jgi:hypoxanthine-DNA glycosylase
LKEEEHMGITKIDYSFEPIIDGFSEVLILGTLPGPESLLKRQYYANPKNQFWSIIYKVFEEESAGSTYNDRTSFILRNKLALWDIFYSAERIGALDADIKNETPNDIPELILAYPLIKRILLNGKKAEKSFSTYFPNMSIETVHVPSTSPAYAKKPFDEKTQEWRDAIKS